MSATVNIPHDLERRSLPERCRWWAHAYSQVRRPNRHVIALLEESATEIELGQATTLTYRGGEQR